ncbi:hypothetical protein GCM10009535_33640 [Streptomyces thermocarboxydovorans]|uniref:Transposase IS701-like DDE domain-containing protein n=1 Tax=Streptomyces thermocarboxydovorans TaxID=59298 RepID=A0ABP3SMI7_9ACTN
MLDGRRKSIRAMASRLPDGNEQNLQLFVNQSTWDPMPVQRRVAERMLALITPTSGVIDDVSVAKNGRTTAHCCRVRECLLPEAGVYSRQLKGYALTGTTTGEPEAAGT